MVHDQTTPTYCYAVYYENNELCSGQDRRWHFLQYNLLARAGSQSEHATGKRLLDDLQGLYWLPAISACTFGATAIGPH